MPKNQLSFQDFVKVFGASIGLGGLFIGALSTFPDASVFMDGLHPSIAFAIGYILQFTVLFFPLWFFVINGKGLEWAKLGFKKISAKRALSVGAQTYATYFLLALAIAPLLHYAGMELPGMEAQESYVPLFGDDTLGIAIGFLFVAIIAPFLEEIFFRGFIYQIFTKTWSVPVGSVLTAALFAFMHLQFANIIPLFIVGLFLNWAYHRTNSVWSSIVFHSMNNTIAFSFTLYLHFAQQGGAIF